MASGFESQKMQTCDMEIWVVFRCVNWCIFSTADPGLWDLKLECAKVVKIHALDFSQHFCINRYGVHLPFLLSMLKGMARTK